MDQDVGTLLDLEVPPSWGMRDDNTGLVWTRNKGQCGMARTRYLNIISQVSVTPEFSQDVSIQEEEK